VAVDPSTGSGVYVADMGNRRVIALEFVGSSVELVGEGRVVDRKRLPSRLCLDVSRDRLYVAYNEWKEVFWTCGGVTVFSVAGRNRDKPAGRLPAAATADHSMPSSAAVDNNWNIDDDTAL
jgi:hypothetical protein